MIRRNIRLDQENYNKLNAYFLTICCYDKNKYFIDKEIIDENLKVLKETAVKFRAKIWAYCFMPDHLHLLVESDNLSKFISSYKQKTGFDFKQRSGNILWQKSFYDHILRADEDIKDTVAYILNNPVRSLLVNNFFDYPYSGSLEFQIADFMEG